MSFNNWVGPKEIFKWPVLGNGKRFLGNSNAWWQPMYRGFTHSFMKVTSRHSFTLFRPLLWKKPIFRGENGLQNVPKCFKSCPLAWNPTGKKQIYMNGKRSYMNGHICKLFHFALSLLNSEIAITPERVARLTWFLAPCLKSKFTTTLFSKKNDFDQPLPRWRPPFHEQYTVSLCRR